VKLLAMMPLAGTARDLVVVAGLIPAACAVYGGLLWILKIEGREELAALWAKFRARM
jgi:putative peptidoglycan lipid II flippase